MYPLEALPGDVYERDGEKVAEVAREVPVAARTIEEGASAPNDGRPSVLSPGEQLQVLEGFVGGYCIQLHRSGARPWPISRSQGPRRRDFAEIIESRTTWSEGG
jgi:hypothetical protein